MPYSAGPNIAARPNLVFEYDLGDVANSYKGEPTTNLLTYSTNFIDGPWFGYCGNKSNLTYNTTDVVAPDGTFTALKVVRNNVTVCDGSTPGWGLLYSAGGTLVSGNIYTTSIWARCASGTVTLNFGISDYYQGSVTLTTTWQRFSFTHNYNPPAQADRVFQFFSTNQDITYYVWGAQTEMKDHATQYIASGASQGVRSNTQGLLDVSGYNRTIDLANMSFNSSAQMIFDGTDDYIPSIGTAVIPAGSVPYTVSVWVNRGRNNVGYEELLAQWTYANSGNSFFFGFNNSNVRFSDSWNDVSVSGAGNTNVWMNLVGVNTGGNAFIYLNGNLAATRGSALTYTGTGPLLMGRQGELPGEYFLGRMNNVQIYNSALSAQDVLRNYNQLKTRFNLQ
jgi:hypothetical protein